LLPGHRNLYIHLHERQDITKKVQKISGDLFHKKRKNSEQAPHNIFNIANFIEELRLVKDQNEILMMKKAMIATDKAHRAAMALAAPGRSEKEVNALIEFIFSYGDSQGNAYDNIVAGGNNANILHYIENNQALKDGDLLLIDAGSQLNNYATDITRTFPVNGKFTGAQRAVYDIVLEAQKTAISHSWPDRTSPELHKSTCNVLTQGLIDLKVLDGSLDENLEKGTFRKYFPHGTGHWLGLDVHDQNPYLDSNDEPIKFEPGVIFTIEPGLYFPAEDASLPEELKGIGIRIEDNILITENGHENLSSMIPKEIKEIEEACEKDYKDFLL
jgi:Xaa-Pro aminopeptidase